MLLAVDTSTPQIGLALYDGAQVLAESLWTSKTRHTVELAPAVSDLLSHAGTRMEQVKALGVAIGPGSFTSLRVGLSFIKGLALALAIPVIGINTLDVVAASQTGGQIPLACLLPAGRGRLAVGWYEYLLESGGASKKISLHLGQKSVWKASGSPRIMIAEELANSITKESLVCGDLSAVERQALKKNHLVHLVSPALSVRRPALLAEMAYTRWQKGNVDDPSTLAPLYLHLAEPIPSVTLPAASENSPGVKQA